MGWIPACGLGGEGGGWCWASGVGFGMVPRMNTRKAAPKSPVKPAKRAAPVPTLAQTAGARPAVKAAVVPAGASAMALPDAKIFLREVDEAMQQERLLALWQRWRWWGLAGVLLAMLSVASWQGWQAWEAHQLRTFAARYATLPENADVVTLQQLQTRAPGGYGALLAMREAKVTTDPKAQAAVYLKLANDGKQAGWVRDTARLAAAMVLLGVDDAGAKTQLELLAQTSDPAATSPLAAPALEQLALLSQRSNDSAAALAYTRRLLDLPGTPEDLRMRAQLRLGLLQPAVQ